MSLKPFTYPFPETRFLHAGSNVYKFKIRYGNSIRGEEIEDKRVIIQELEDSIRAVLANMDSLQPFVTEHFIVFPYKSKWERVSHLKFKHGEIILTPYPFVFTLYIEMKWFAESLPSGKPADDIPLELVLAEKEAEEATMRKRKLWEEPNSPRRPGLHRAKMETSSEASSTKEPLKESKRSRDEEGQQEYQASPASNAISDKERDATLGHSLPGLVVPSLQHSNPSPLKEPGARGFLGFLSHSDDLESRTLSLSHPDLVCGSPEQNALANEALMGTREKERPPRSQTPLLASCSALFPFRYFFRKSSQ